MDYDKIFSILDEASDQLALLKGELTEGGFNDDVARIKSDVDDLRRWIEDYKTDESYEQTVDDAYEYLMHNGRNLD